MPAFGVILAAAGRSSRFGSATTKKPFATLAGRAVWMHAAEKFVDRPDVKQVVVVVAPEDRAEFVEKFGATLAFMGVKLAEGGEQRVDSVRRGLAALGPECDMVAIHDAARPCLAPAWIDRVFTAGVRDGAAILGTPVVATLKRVDPQHAITGTVDRTGLWEAQTPQVFRRDLLERGFASRDGDAAPTDEAQLVEALGQRVTVVPGSPLNLKITSREDLKLAELALKALPTGPLKAPGHPFADDDMWR